MGSDVHGSRLAAKGKNFRFRFLQDFAEAGGSSSARALPPGSLAEGGVGAPLPPRPVPGLGLSPPALSSAPPEGRRRPPCVPPGLPAEVVAALRRIFAACRGVLRARPKAG